MNAQQQQQAAWTAARALVNQCALSDLEAVDSTEAHGQWGRKGWPSITRAGNAFIDFCEGYGGDVLVQMTDDNGECDELESANPLQAAWTLLRRNLGE